jgi:hypothetical protein
MRPLRVVWDSFWGWYHRNYLAVLVISTAVFVLQIFHLYWLFTDVVLDRLMGRSFFAFPAIPQMFYVLADYLEIPTLVSVSLLYVADLRRGATFRSILYLVLLNTQWIHMFWITDEVVVQTFAGHGFIAWNAMVAWVAILIDYLEVPVIVDTLRKVWQERSEIMARVRRRDRQPGLQEAKLAA